MRLAKYIAHAGVASRRAAERLIAEGRVRVDGEPATDPARDVTDKSRVTVDGRTVGEEAREYHALNKPRGVVSTARDTHGRGAVTDFVDSEARLYPVGRLDADSTGLILLTNDGELANRLTHPSREVEKIYRVMVRGAPSKADLRFLREGVALEDGRTAPARVQVLASNGGRTTLEIAIHEGRKRILRRMLEAVGHPVAELERTAIGPLKLGRLAPGSSRRLRPSEIEALRHAAGLTSDL
jgi:23S rRNA pseudouridine2605 synthase